MAFPVQDPTNALTAAKQDPTEAHMRALIAKATEQSDGREAMHFTQAALNAAQVLMTLKLIERGETK